MDATILSPGACGEILDKLFGHLQAGKISKSTIENIIKKHKVFKNCEDSFLYSFFQSLQHAHYKCQAFDMQHAIHEHQRETWAATKEKLKSMVAAEKQKVESEGQWFLNFFKDQAIGNVGYMFVGVHGLFRMASRKSRR